MSVLTVRERRTRTVLVPHADSLAGLGAIRSLGRAGYRVLAASARADALGFASRYPVRRLIQPAVDSPSFKDWLYTLTQQEQVELVLPSESYFAALWDDYDTFRSFFPLPATREACAKGFSKYLLFKHAPAVNIPPTLLVEPVVSDDEIRHWVGQTAGPYFIKADAIFTTDRRAVVMVARNESAALHAIESMRNRAGCFIVQGFVEGRGVAHCVLRWRGRIDASMSFRRLHEVPHTGGISSLRETYTDPLLEVDAQEKLAAIAWHGVAMVEYRKDVHSGRLYLMESNCRLWGSLHLALHAGVDFPRLLVDRALFDQSEPTPMAPAGVKARLLFPAELQHVWSVLADGELDRHRKREAVKSLAIGTIDPQIRSDLLAFGDPMPLGRAAWNMMVTTASSGLNRLRRRYGRLSGLLRHVFTQSLVASRQLRAFHAPLRQRPERVVFVCAGNICRSAYAEARLRAICPSLRIASFGLTATAGKESWQEIVADAGRRHIDLSAHRSTPLETDSLQDGDLVLAFEVSHAQRLRSLANGKDVEVRLLGMFAEGGALHIEDPYGLPHYVPTCLDVIDDALSNLSAALHATATGAQTRGIPLPE